MARSPVNCRALFARYWKFELIRKLVVLLLVGLFSAALLLGYSAWKFDAALKQPLNLTQEQLLDVPAGATPTGTFNRLEADGVLDGAFWLRLYWRFNLDGQPLHSGEYRMTPGMTAQGLIGLWQRGEVVQYSLTLVEGWNFRQVRSALAKHEKIVQSLSGLTDSEVMDKLGHPGVFPEGRFFPDTYRFVRGMTDVEFLKKPTTAWTMYSLRSGASAPPMRHTLTLIKR